MDGRESESKIEIWRRGTFANFAAWDYRLQSDADSDSALSHLSVQLLHLSLLQRDKYVQLSTAV
jgi:hypothetical protein